MTLSMRVISEFLFAASCSGALAAAVGLAIIIQLYRMRSTVNVDEVKTLHG